MQETNKTNRPSLDTQRLKRKWIISDKVQKRIRKFIRYFLDHPYFVMMHYFIHLLFCIVSTFYILTGDWFAISVFWLITINIVGMIVVTLCVYWRASFKSQRNTELVIYIPVALYFGISIVFCIISGKAFFRYFACTEVFAFLSYLLWRWVMKKVPNTKYVITIFSVGFSISACWYAMQSIYEIYSSFHWIQDVWNWSWRLLFYQSTEEIIIFMREQAWLSTGITLLLGCLLIVTWARNKPCEDWNPFTAQDLLLSNSVMFISLFCLVVFLYSMVISAYRFAFIDLLILLASNVTTLVFCNHMQNDVYIRHKVKHYLRLFDIKYYSYRYRPVLDQIESSLLDIPVDTLMQYKSYIHKLQDIASTTIRHMKENNCKQQIQHAYDLIEVIGKKMKISVMPDNIGFLTGLGFIPQEVDEEVKLENATIYFSGLYIKIKSLLGSFERDDNDPDEVDNSKEVAESIADDESEIPVQILRVKEDKHYVHDASQIYYTFVIVGMYFGLLVLEDHVKHAPWEETEIALKALGSCCKEFGELATETIGEFGKDELSHLIQMIARSNRYDIRSFFLVSRKGQGLSKFFNLIYDCEFP